MTNFKFQMSNGKNWKLVIGYLILVVFVIGIIPSAHAQGFALGVFPPIIQIDAEPPASIKNPITLENNSDDPITLNIGLRPFRASEKENGETAFEDNDPKYQEIFKRIQIFEGERVITAVTLSPKQKKNLTLHIGLTENDQPSDYYFSVIFISADKQTSQSSSSQSIGGIATNVLLSIGPKGQALGEISKFEAPFFLSRGPVDFKVHVNNKSSFFVTTRGQILIKNTFGQTVADIELLPVNILSGSKRIVPSINDLENPRATWGEKFPIGIYTAIVRLSLTDEGPLLAKSLTFIAFPIELFIGLIASILVVVFIYRKVKIQRSL